MAYTYLITNKLTGQFYYGSRTASDSASDLWIKYFTSSTHVKELIELHGKDSFESKIVFEYDDHDVCYWYEQLLIRDSINHEKSLNKHFIDPDTGIRKFSCAGITWTEEQKEKLRKPKTELHKLRMRQAKQRYFSDPSHKEAYRERVRKLFHEGKIKKNITPEYREKLSAAIRRHMSNPEVRQRLSEQRSAYIAEHRDEVVAHLVNLNKSRIGIPLTDEHRAKISEGSKNRPTATDETKKKLSDSLKDKPKSEDAKQAMKEAWVKRKQEGKDSNNPFKQKVTCPNCGKEGQSTCMKRWHFDNCKLK